MLSHLRRPRMLCSTIVVLCSFGFVQYATDELGLHSWCEAHDTVVGMVWYGTSSCCRLHSSFVDLALFKTIFEQVNKILYSDKTKRRDEILCNEMRLYAVADAPLWRRDWRHSVLQWHALSWHCPSFICRFSIRLHPLWEIKGMLKQVTATATTMTRNCGQCRL